MSQHLHCSCGAKLPWTQQSHPSLARCHCCGRDLSEQARLMASGEEPVLATMVPHWSTRMLNALLDPRSIQYMLMLGGGLMVLGLVLWLISSELFENKWVVAGTLTAGSLLIHLVGCAVALKTRYKIAGNALTFLGCLLLPLNLWFAHSHGLITLQDNLWMGGVVCCAVYVATVLLLRNPLFLYAVEGGITLTAVLMLGHQGVVADTTWLSVVFMALALISIHAERAFPVEAETFSRKRFGLPLFWAAQVQLAAAIVALLGSQLLANVLIGDFDWFGVWAGNALTQHHWLAGGLWLVGAYAYLYSDLVVRRLGWYVYAAVFCLIGAELTFVGYRLPAEWLIAIPAFTALAITLLVSRVGEDDHIARRLPPLATALAAISVIAGVIQHILATSLLLNEMGLARSTGWAFFGTMVFVALANRVMVFLLERKSTSAAQAHLFLSAASVLVAAAGLARCLQITDWTQQAPLLMLVPMAYLFAARLWRGQMPEKPLAISAQVGAAIILLHVLFNAFIVRIGNAAGIEVATGSNLNLWLGLVFIQAALFYLCYAILFRQAFNVYVATAAACGAVWQLANYNNVPESWYTMAYASLGLLVLGVARLMHAKAPTPESMPSPGEAPLRRGEVSLAEAVMQSAHALLSLALLSALLQGLSRLTNEQANWGMLRAMGLTTLAGLVAIALAPSATWRRVYSVFTLCLAGLSFATLNVLSELHTWQKVEIFSVVVGLVILIASYVGRFMEPDDRETDHITIGLWFGSLMPAGALLIATLYHRFALGHVSLPDELGLLAVTVLMLASGFVWQLKSPAVIGGGTLLVYLVVMIGTLAYFPNVAIGVYLAVGGGLLFGAGLALSIFRERIVEIPEKISKREGVFQVLNWR
jgi:hypothetical protein